MDRCVEPEGHFTFLNLFRGVDGSFDRTFEILRDARELGLTTQVNTSITQLNRHELDRIASDLAALGAGRIAIDEARRRVEIREQ